MNLKKLSEDEVRTKIVNEWLKDCGLSAEQIRIEFSINLQLGKGVRTINSRTDVLVRNTIGDNLLIIELKKPSHKLQDGDQRQALSYSRSLAEGGIAPFTILTNLKEVRIFDSVSGIEIGANVPNSHPVVVNNFKVTGDSLSARAEALEYLITLSKDNLMTFCSGQVDFRMKLLKGDDPWSEKKYIPRLYVNRISSEKDLKYKLFDPSKNKDIVLVVGPPQHGKTCLMCYTAERYLKEDIPVLFYPAIGLDNGLLEAIQEDFCWTFGENLSTHHTVSRLVRVTEQLKSPLLIIVDGWNEMGERAVRINNELQRLEHKNIKVVLSTTSPSLGKLLLDDADNLTYVAVTTQLKNTLIKRLSSEPLHNIDGLDIVQIGNFDYTELEKGKEIYGSIFNVDFSTGTELPYDPFYLRIAAEEYANSSIPSFPTLTKLIGDSLIRKAKRRGIKEIELFSVLDQLAKIILKYDTPFPSTLLIDELAKEAKLALWTECGILQLITSELIPQIDFYLTHHKSYAIAIVHRHWQSILLTKDANQIDCEINLALQTTAGQTALSWFLSAPEHVHAFKIIFSSSVYFKQIDSRHLKVFSDAIANQINFNQNLTFDWLDEFINNIYDSDIDQSEIIDEITVLIYSLIKSLDRVEKKDKYEFWMRILLKIDNSLEELGFEDSYVHKIYGEDIRSHDGYDEFYDGDFDLTLFEKLTFDNDAAVAEKALTYMAYASPYYTQAILLDVINHHRAQLSNEEVENVILRACEWMLSNLRSVYWGDMCRGWFTDAEPGDEEATEEFYNQKLAWFPILKFLNPNSNLKECIIALLKDLSDYVIETTSISQDESESSDPKQLKLDF